MTSWFLWTVCIAAALTGITLLRRPLGVLARVAARSAAGLALLWLFNLMGSGLGLHVGINLLTGLAVGILGFPGFGLLLLLQCL